MSNNRANNEKVRTVKAQVSDVDTKNLTAILQMKSKERNLELRASLVGFKDNPLPKAGEEIKIRVPRRQSSGTLDMTPYDLIEMTPYDYATGTYVLGLVNAERRPKK